MSDFGQKNSRFYLAGGPRRIGRHHYKSLMTDVMGEIAGKAVTLNPIPQPTRWGTMGGCSTNLLKSEKLEYDDHPGKYLVPHGFMDLARGEKGVTRKMAIEFVSRVGDPRYRCATCFTGGAHGSGIIVLHFFLIGRRI